VCYTIIVPREMRITAEGTHQTRKRRASRGGNFIKQVADKKPEKILKKLSKTP
jgi:hypothetical protein